MNKSKLFKILIALVVILGLVASVILVKKNQETRRGAAFTTTTIRVEPAAISGNVGEIKTVAVYLDTPRSINVAKVKLCYGSSLELAGISGIDISVSKLKVMNYNPKIENNCVIVSQSIDPSSVNSVSDYPTGAIQLMNITFTVKASGNLTIDKNASLIAGAPINNNDVNVLIDSVTGATVTLSSGGGTTSNGTLSFESSDLTSKKNGETLDVNLVINTTKNFDAVEAKLCYGNKLSLAASDVTLSSGSDFTQIVKKTISNNCLDYAVIAQGKVLTGKKIVANLKFKAIGEGSGKLELSNSDFSNAVDGMMTLSVIGADYTINPVTTTPCIPSCASNQICTNGICVNSNQCKYPGVGIKGKCSNGADCGTETCYCYLGDETTVGSVSNTGDQPMRICRSDGVNNCTGYGKCTDGTGCGQTNSKGESCVCLNVSSNVNTRFDYLNTNRTCTLSSAQVITCTSFTYSTWSACANNTQTRTVATSTPTACTGGTPVLSQSCTPTPVCTNGAKQCYNTVNYQTCVNGAWGAVTACGTGQLCSGAGQCLSNTTLNTPIVIKMAFAGVRKGNTQCIVNWLTGMKVRDAAGNNPLTVDAEVGSVPVETDSVNSKGDVIFTYSTYLVEFDRGVATNGLSFFLTGPKHISIKYGNNNQNSWYSTLAGNLRITGGVDNGYDFSEYALLAGDVTGDIVGTPDGKIDGRDWSFIKQKTQPITVGSDGVDLAGDVDGNCRVNSGDERIMKESLVEINSQLY